MSDAQPYPTPEQLIAEVAKGLGVEADVVTGLSTLTGEDLAVARRAALCGLQSAMHRGDHLVDTREQLLPVPPQFINEWSPQGGFA